MRNTWIVLAGQPCSKRMDGKTLLKQSIHKLRWFRNKSEYFKSYINTWYVIGKLMLGILT
jgi:hypothetical protein